MLIKGLKFGMLLQFAIGPMCLFVFNSSVNYGFLTGTAVVLAIAMVDAIYITLAGFGLATVINKKGRKKLLKYLGAAVLLLFGVNTIVSTLGYSILPSISIKTSSSNLFLQAFLMTASNPLTIIFWSGVFSSQVIENNMSKSNMLPFGAGCVLSTLLFLTAIAILGSTVGIFLTSVVMFWLNIVIGCLLIFFGLRLLIKK